MTANMVLTIINQGQCISSYDRETSHVNWRVALAATALVPSLSPPSLHWPVQQTHEQVSEMYTSWRCYQVYNWLRNPYLVNSNP